MRPILFFFVLSIMKFGSFRASVKEAASSLKSLLSPFPPYESDRSDGISMYYREICHEELYREKGIPAPPPSIMHSNYRFSLPPDLRTAVPPLYECTSGLKVANAPGPRHLPVQSSCYECVMTLSTGDQHLFLCY